MPRRRVRVVGQDREMLCRGLHSKRTNGANSIEGTITIYTIIRTIVREVRKVRIQRKRSAGWRMPPNAVYVGRPTRWGNPFKVGVDGTLGEVIEKYRIWLEGRLKEDPDFLNPLKGKDLACWCPLDKPCHADVLLRRLEVGTP